MLVPAGVLVLVVLASISVDSALAFMAQRSLQNEVAAAANDAATVAVAPEQLQRGSAATIDAGLVRSVVDAHFAAADLGSVRLTAVEAVPRSAVMDGEQVQVVEVTARGDVDYIFAKAIPGARSTAHVSARAQARLQFRGPE